MMEGPMTVQQFIPIVEAEAERESWRRPLIEVADDVARQMGARLPVDWEDEIIARGLLRCALAS